MAKRIEIVPTQDWLLIQPVVQSKTDSGLVLPDQHSLDGRAPTRGKILCAGPDAPEEAIEGALVLFDKYAPKDFLIAGQKLLMLRAADVCGFVLVIDEPELEVVPARALSTLNGSA